MIGNCPRFEELGFTTSRAAYIHCSDICENVAKVDFGWKPASLKAAPCPPPLDTSEYFGANVVDDGLLADNEDGERGDATASLGRRRRARRVSESPLEVCSTPVRSASASFGTARELSAQKRRRLDGKEIVASGPVIINVDSPEVIEIIDVDSSDGDDVVHEGRP